MPIITTSNKLGKRYSNISNSIQQKANSFRSWLVKSYAIRSAEFIKSLSLSPLFLDRSIIALILVFRLSYHFQRLFYPFSIFRGSVHSGARSFRSLCEMLIQLRQYIPNTTKKRGITPDTLTLVLNTLEERMQLPDFLLRL